MENSEKEKILASLIDEQDGVILYQAMAEAEKDPRIAEIYRRMAQVEKRHAETLARRLQAENVAIPSFQVSWRTKILSWLARRFGPGAVLPTIINLEQTDTVGYSKLSGASKIAADENSHARILTKLTRSMPGGMEGGILAQFEGRHRATGGNALRAAVLGANDGLVSNLSLVMGVAGAALNNHAIMITGLAGLLAGASSMALGEWLSVQSSRELYQHQLGIEKNEIMLAPEEEAEELALIYQARGLPEEQAQLLAAQIISDEDNALETLAREELNIDPQELGGSAWEAAFTSFFLFAVGAIIPVSAFLFLSGLQAVVVSVLFSTVGLFLIGAVTTLFTGRSVLFSGMRMVIFGLGAAALTYTIGHLIGVNIGG